MFTKIKQTIRRYSNRRQLHLRAEIAEGMDYVRWRNDAWQPMCCPNQ